MTYKIYSITARSWPSKLFFLALMIHEKIYLSLVWGNQPFEISSSSPVLMVAGICTGHKAPSKSHFSEVIWEGHPWSLALLNSTRTNDGLAVLLQYRCFCTDIASSAGNSCAPRGCSVWFIHITYKSQVKNLAVLNAGKNFRLCRDSYLSIIL